MGKLDGRVAIITGGASGIGKASTRLFVEEGARVLIGDIMDDRGEALAQDIGENALYMHMDVSQEEQVQGAVAEAVKRYGKLDCIFNNAGIGGASGMIEEIPAIGFDITVAINLRGVFFGMKHAAPVMKAQGSGSIISTASIAGHRTGFGGHIYSACKAAIIHMTRSVAVELGVFGIRANSICPGVVVTSIFARTLGLDQDAAEATYEGLAEAFANLQSIQRPCMPEDVARVAVWLASDESAYVSGAAIRVDGALPDGMFNNDELVDKLGEIMGIELPTQTRPGQGQG
jgi:NAD(P)-dependent dehydrogenase (short-subunit alcohol dehydrogenase family)